MTEIFERGSKRQEALSPSTLLEVDELARVLGRTVRAVKRDVRHNPERLPLRLQLPGTKLLRWCQEVVEFWLTSELCAASTEAKRR